MRTLLVLLISSSLILGPPVFADEKKDKQHQLTQLKSRIEKLRKTIEVKENSRSTYHRQLRKIEKQIGRLGQQISQSRNRIRKKQRELDRLQEAKRGIQSEIRNQNKQLSRQVHAAYTLGQQEQLKLFFSQQNAANLQRNLTYYEYFSRYRLGLINTGRENYQRLLDNENLISRAKLAMQQELDEQRRQQSRLGKDRHQREKIIVSLEKELHKQGTHLGQLEDNARNLTKLIDSLDEILTGAPAPDIPHQQFSSLRGKLAWPVKGKVRKLFGEPKPPSNLRWQGVIIQAKTGNNVRAVSHGRIAFADWLRGMGNLIIIDHGQGYLSLYGHNQSLYKAAGEWVEAGDIIASIGNSGGQKKPGLYFEIRKKGKPQNPSRWCKTSNWFAT